MVLININFDDIGKQVDNIVDQQIIDTLKKRFQEIVVPELNAVVNQTIEENKELFIPDNREAGELGIQSAQKFPLRDQAGRPTPQVGAIEERRRSGAYRNLLIGSPGSSAIVEASISPRRVGTIANYRVAWDKDIFFSAIDSRFDIVTVQDNEPFELRWMEWFLEGKVIAGHAFSPFAPVSSRTGRGIMVQGGIWEFRPRSGRIERLGQAAARAVEIKMLELFEGGRVI